MSKADSKWLDAHIGATSPQMALRVTEEEKLRLEQLRRAHGLTSKSQVVRLALDLLEAAVLPGTWVWDGMEGVRENEQIFDRLRARLVEGADAECGSPASAPAPDQADQRGSNS